MEGEDWRRGKGNEWREKRKRLKTDEMYERENKGDEWKMKNEWEKIN